MYRRITRYFRYEPASGFSPISSLTSHPHLLNFDSTCALTNKKAERARGPFCPAAGWTSFLGDNTWEGHPGSRLEPPTSIRKSRLPRSSLESDAQSSLSRFCPEFRAVGVPTMAGHCDCARTCRPDAQHGVRRARDLRATLVQVSDSNAMRAPAFLTVGAHRETIPPNQLSPALPLLEKQARFSRALRMRPPAR
jgi:hypothetical protein